MTDALGESPTAAMRSRPWPNRTFAAGARADHRAHLAAYGELPIRAMGPQLVAELEKSGLSGRGGAGFPTGRKFGAVPRLTRPWRPSSVVIANGAEGEPRSIKDERLLRDAPHLVIDGLLAAAAAVQAERAFLYATPESLGFVRRALRERRDVHRIDLVEAPETFVSGEASAVVNAVENGIALPVDRVVRLTESGYKRRPTLVQNVETLAHVAMIARYGAEWFRRVGTPRDPGTRLLTISGAVAHEGVLEVPGDVPLADVLSAAGYDPLDAAAVLVGGYHGAWITSAHFGAALSPAGLSPYGAHPGAGIIVVLSRRSCGLQHTAEIVRYLARESAQQCGPCRFGLPEIADLMESIAYGVRDPSLALRVADLTASVVGRGSCHHPAGTSRLVASALSAFSADVTAHQSGRCLRTPGGRE